MNLIVFFRLVMLLKLASSVTIDCGFKNFTTIADSNRTYSTSDVYSCEVRALETSEHENYVTDVEGDHLVDMTNENVTHLLIADQKVEFFPGGLDKFFPNLETVTIKRSAVKYIFKADLVGLSKLRFLALGDNKIELLGPGLFEGNPLLEEIHFENNEISKISEDLLDPLGAFPKVIHFYNNTCIKEDLKTPDSAGFKDLVRKNCELSKVDLIENGDKQVKKLMAKIETLETAPVDLTPATPAPPDSKTFENAETLKLTNEIKILETNVTLANEELERLGVEMKVLKEDNVELESARKKLSKNLTETLSELVSVETDYRQLENSYDGIKYQLLNKTTTEDVIVMVMTKLAAKLHNYQADNADLDKQYDEKLKEKDLAIEKVEADRDRILEEKNAAEKKIHRLEVYSKELNTLLTKKSASLAFKHKTKH